MSDALVIEAVRKSVTVNCPVEEAFRVFTADATSWWPIATHSIRGDVKEVVFEGHEGGEVYEVGETGEHRHWATVVAWEPPGRIVLAWNILERAAVPTEVEVRFAPAGEKTRVDVEHRGWESVAEEAEAKRASYDTGWDQVLGVFRDRLEQTP
jgi:uncharacterized protein YndB with AHSA1/START domain